MELVALFSIGTFAWTHFNGFARYALVLILPAFVMIIWSVFAVPGDPSRGSDGVVAVSGMTRLILEFFVFGAGFIALYYSSSRIYSLTFLLLIVLHYVASLDRIKWLLER
ncbi:YrdB family protein [Brevibacillus dissolubilis]|uniref:YrdB family protein n=1 Tax=Brevibacillus dissolubilis TaxID=1844116 RepID=UPI0021003C72|nr:YrdB family protein [Brevibacillus dissolubilis]